MRKIRIFISAAAVSAAAFIFAGCGTAYTQTTFVLNKDGSAKQYIIEAADEDTTISELKAYVEDSLVEYRGGSELESVKLDKCDIKDGKVDIEMSYASCDDYAAYNDVVCFEGSFADASDAGFDLDLAYKTPEGSSVSYGDLVSMQENIRVLVMNEVTAVKLPGTVLAYSTNAAMNEDGTLSAIPDTDESIPDEFRTINLNNTVYVYTMEK